MMTAENSLTKNMVESKITPLNTMMEKVQQCTAVQVVLLYESERFL